MEKYADYISKIDIAELWHGRKHIQWTLDPEVNVLSGVNGIGKSTILHRIVSGVKSVDSSDDGIKIEVMPQDAELVRFDLITTPDVRSEYDINLDGITDRFVRHSHDEERILQLWDTIDELFLASEKTVMRSDTAMVMMQFGEQLDLHLLSSGEKQMLTILLTVYLEDQQPTVLFMDEPEVSLHIEWQQQLIKVIRLLNPKVQIILTTHSPAIIMQGWMDKVTDVADITVGA